jgi:hypothetical protein
MASRFDGMPVDNFFLQYGPPSSSYTLQDGRRMYIWAEHPQTLELHGLSTATVNVVGNTAFVSGFNDPHSTITMQCQVRILTRPNGTIQQILSQYDTVGWWQLSRCNEIFGR